MKHKFLLAVAFVLVLVVSSTPLALAELSTALYGPYAKIDTKTYNAGNFQYWNALRLNGGMLEKPNLKMGDVNLDGAVNAVDALFALQYAVRGTAFSKSPQTGFLFRFEGVEESYFRNKKYESSDVGLYDARFYCYYFNSSYAADLNPNDMVDANDALIILKMAVGKIEFWLPDLVDFSQKYGVYQRYTYCPWPDDWEPGMLYKSPSVTYDEEYYQSINWPPEG